MDVCFTRTAEDTTSGKRQFLAGLIFTIESRVLGMISQSDVGLKISSVTINVLLRIYALDQGHIVYLKDPEVFWENVGGSLSLPLLPLTTFDVDIGDAARIESIRIVNGQVRAQSLGYTGCSMVSFLFCTKLLLIYSACTCDVGPGADIILRVFDAAMCSRLQVALRGRFVLSPFPPLVVASLSKRASLRYDVGEKLSVIFGNFVNRMRII